MSIESGSRSQSKEESNLIGLPPEKPPMSDKELVEAFEADEVSTREEMSALREELELDSGGGSANDPAFDRTPFILEDYALSSLSSIITGLEKNKDKLVREEPMVGDIAQTKAHYLDIKKMFETMRDEYGVNIPNIDMVMGEKEKGEKRVFMVVDRIAGESLDGARGLPKDQKDKFEVFYTGLLSSAFDAYKNKKTFFYDIKPANIMYGHKSKEKNAEDDFFLHDVGDALPYRDEEKYNQTFFLQIINEAGDMGEYEQMFEGGVSLDKVREKFKEIIEYCQTEKKEELEAYMIDATSVKESMDKFLNNSKYN